MRSQLSERPGAVRLQYRHNGCDSAMSALRHGTPIVVANPGGCDLVLAAAQATPVSTAFLIRYGSGFITVTMRAERLAELNLPALPVGDLARRSPALHVAVDASAGVTTGISAHDRALTIRCLGETNSTPRHFTRPGHVLPVRVDLAANRPPGPAETAAMAGLVATGAVETAICSLVSASDPAGIAQSWEGEQFALTNRIPFVHSWQITQSFYQSALMWEMDAL